MFVLFPTPSHLAWDFNLYHPTLIFQDAINTYCFYKTPIKCFQQGNIFWPTTDTICYFFVLPLKPTRYLSRKYLVQQTCAWPSIATHQIILHDVGPILVEWNSDCILPWIIHFGIVEKLATGPKWSHVSYNGKPRLEFQPIPWMWAFTSQSGILWSAPVR